MLIAAREAEIFQKCPCLNGAPCKGFPLPCCLNTFSCTSVVFLFSYGDFLAKRQVIQSERCNSILK